MITKKDIEQLESLDKAEQDLKDIQMELLLKTKKEEERRNEWGIEYHAYQAKIRAVQTRINGAAEVRNRLYNETPVELRQAAEAAAAALRGHAGACDRARRDLAASVAILERRQAEAQRTGFPIDKYEREVIEERICAHEAVAKEVEQSRKKLDADNKKAQARLTEAQRQIKAMAK